MKWRAKMQSVGLVALFALPICVLTILLTSSPVSADDFLKFHWKFDEGTGTTAGDASGNTPSYAGTLYGGPTWLVGGGLGFDGINDYARTNSPLPNSMGVANQAYTLSASVRVAPGETEGNIVHISNGANGIGWCISMLHITGGRFRAIGWQASQPVIATAPTTANTGEWYSIANTWSPEEDELRLYVNGALVAATPMTSYMAAGEDVYVFAGIDAGNCNNNRGWFKGDVKDVRIYNRAISQEEAEENSNESLGVPPLTITTPADGAVTNTWNPAVNWADANECSYSFNNIDWESVDCEDSGGDIPPPDDDGVNLKLYVRSKYTGEEMYAVKDVAFTYDSSAPLVNAGDNIHTGSAPIQLDSPTASDTTSGIANYSWTKHSGPGTIDFSNSALLKPNITSVSQDGTYQLLLTVTDEAGNSAFDDFTLLWDTENPEIQLVDFPDATTTVTNAQFEFTGTDNLSDLIEFECSINNSSYTSCASPLELTNLALGEHTFSVRGRDAANNSTEVLTYSWVITAALSNDANGDGIADNAQPQVLSFTNPDTGITMVLEADEGCVVEEAIIKAERTHSAQDPKYEYPEGLFNFTLECDEPGFTTTIKQYYYNVNRTDSTVRKYNPNNNKYFDIAGAATENTTIHGSQVTIASYSITDGGELDIDGQANGTIVDPAGLAVADTSTGPHSLANTGDSAVTRILLSLIFIVFGAPLIYVNRRALTSSK